MRCWSIVALREEDAVAFMSDDGDLAGRGISRVGDKRETILRRRPRDSCRTLDELAREIHRRVAHLEPARHAAPANIERGGRFHRGAVVQGVHNIVVILEFEIRNVQPGSSGAQVDLHAIRGERHRPEQTAWSDAGVEIVILRATRAPEEIQSYKAECAVVMLPVHADILALHKTHVNVEGNVACFAGRGVRSRSGARDLGDANEAVEIGDR